jgi:hypothetical protein
MESSKGDKMHGIKGQPAFAVGQVWRTRDGQKVLVDEISDNARDPYPIRGIVGGAPQSWDGEGRFGVDVMQDEHLDLLTCIRYETIADVIEAGSEALRTCTLHPANEITGDGSGTALPHIVESAIHSIAAEHQAALLMEVDGYESLAGVLREAYAQAATGKGRERHAQGEPFDRQVMQIGADKFGIGSLLFQAFKKSEESQRLDDDRAIKELLGSINYLAGAVIAIRRRAAAEGRAK